MTTTPRGAQIARTSYIEERVLDDGEVAPKVASRRRHEGCSPPTRRRRRGIPRTSSTAATMAFLNCNFDSSALRTPNDDGRKLGGATIRRRLRRRRVSILGDRNFLAPHALPPQRQRVAERRLELSIFAPQLHLADPSHQSTSASRVGYLRLFERQDGRVLLPRQLRPQRVQPHLRRASATK